MGHFGVKSTIIVCWINVQVSVNRVTKWLQNVMYHIWQFDISVSILARIVSTFCSTLEKTVKRTPRVFLCRFCYSPIVTLLLCLVFGVYYVIISHCVVSDLISSYSNQIIHASFASHFMTSKCAVYVNVSLYHIQYNHHIDYYVLSLIPFTVKEGHLIVLRCSDLITSFWSYLKSLLDQVFHFIWSGLTSDHCHIIVWYHV